MLDGLSEVSSLHIHRLNSVPALLSLELVRQRLLHAHAFEIQKSHEALVLSTVAHNMVRVVVVLTHINFVLDHVARSAHLHLQEESDVHESKVTIQKML